MNDLLDVKSESCGDNIRDFTEAHTTSFLHKLHMVGRMCYDQITWYAWKDICKINVHNIHVKIVHRHVKIVHKHVISKTKTLLFQLSIDISNINVIIPTCHTQTFIHKIEVPGQQTLYYIVSLIFYFFYFIECFTTTFLRAHSWLNWVDEDEVGLKEKPEDTRYIKKITSK